MKITSIKSKVLLLLLTITVVVIISMALLMQLGFVQGFTKYKKSLEKELNNRMITALETHYADHNSWQAFTENPRLWHELIFSSATDAGQPVKQDKPKRKPKHNKPPGRKHTAEKGHRRPPRNPELQRVLPSYTLFDHNRNKVIGPGQWLDKNTAKLKLKLDNQVIGYISHNTKRGQDRSADKQFNRTFLVLLVMVSAVMMLVVILFTVPIAKYFTRPISALNKATQAAAAGDYSVRTYIERRDELGQLGQNFNMLTSTLQSKAAVQKKMMADIAHELRTPVAVLLAEIEAIQDGIHQADESNLNLLHQQISALKHLINDLHQLSIADLGSMQYQMQPVDLQKLITDAHQALQLKAKEKDISMNCKLTAKEGMWVLGDHNRLTQLINNLLNNSIAYTSTGGKINISQGFDEDSEEHIITIEDTEPGLTTEEREKMFDRLYRKESSRNKKSGGSGLGLAIAKNIIEAHNGNLIASASTLGGVCMTMRIPRHV